MNSDSCKISIYKAISWTVIGFILTASFIFAITGNFILASSIGIAERIVKFTVYFFHERFWNKIIENEKNHA